MAAAGQWSCVDLACRSQHARATLALVALPSSPQTPLVFVCGHCSTCAVLCEGCWALVPMLKRQEGQERAESTGESLGVLACRRCGVLSVQREELRALLQLPPRADTDGTLWREVKLEEQERVQERASRIRHELRARRDGDPSSPPLSSEKVTQLKTLYIELEKELKRLAKERIQALASHPEASTRRVPPTFSPTQLHLLRVMYENSAEKSAVVNVVPAIESFLETQSTLLQLKFDLLAAYRAYKLGDLLDERDPPLNKGGLSQAISMASSYWEAQLEFQWREYQALGDQHLSTVGIANGFLLQLYTRAWTHTHDLNHSTTGIMSPAVAATFSPMSRKRRRFASPMLSGGSRVTSNLRTVDGSRANHPPEITQMQQQLEHSNRLADISKKVELWRSLTLAISSAAVVSVEDMAHAIVS